MRNCLLIFFSFLFIKISAQQKKAEQIIGWKGNDIELHSISDNAKKLVCNIIVSEDSMRAYMLDHNLTLKEPVNITRKRNENLLGGFFKDNKIYIFLDNGRDPGLHVWVLDNATGIGMENVIPFDFKKEKVIDKISCGDHFLYFSINKKTSEFVIHDFKNEKDFTTTSFAFEKGIWDELTEMAGFGRSLDVQKIDFEGDCNVDVAARPNKVYFDNDTLYLLINKVKGLTKIISFNLPDQKMSLRKIRHAFPKQFEVAQSDFVDNSYLLKDKLYYVQATSDSMQIQILDFYSGNLIKEYSVKRADDILFKNTPIIQEGGGTVYSLNSTRELDKTRQLIRKMLNGNAVVMATLNDMGQVELSIGSFKKMASGGGGGMWMPAGGGSSSMTFMPTGGFDRSTWSKSARFKMLINSRTGEHIDGAMNASINEKIEDYTKGIKIPPQAENLFIMDGKYYYAYYDRKERKLSYVLF